MRNILGVIILSITLCASAFGETSQSFYSTWKLLSAVEKQQFAAGYLHGWNDAKNVTDIAINFIKENPQSAVTSLEGVRKLYDVSTVRPERLVSALDDYYSNPDNKSSSLSAAVTAAKSSL